MAELRETERLYERDVWLRSFEGQVLACEPKGDCWEAALDRTAFFPEGGGQGGDRGTLGEAHVLDTHERGGVIWHTVDSPLPAGEAVHGEVDPLRRMDMMQQHTGEHILSGLTCARLDCRNVGFHIGSDAVTLDFSKEIDPQTLAELELEANRAVWRDIPVEAWVPDREELRKIPYRSKKEIEGDLRLVRIAGVDTCACCGTHCETTGQVGMIKVFSCIHYKGGSRLSILCGRRALEKLNEALAEQREVSHLLSAKPGTLAEATSRLLAERDALSWQAENTGVTLFEREMAGEQGKTVRVIAAPYLSPARLRKAAGQLADGARYALVLIPRSEGGCAFALSGTDDVRPAARELMERFGGKGGGPADMVQGTLAAQPASAELRELLEGMA